MDLHAAQLSEAGRLRQSPGDPALWCSAEILAFSLLCNSTSSLSALV